MRKALLACAAILMLSRTVLATGFMVPSDRRLDCLELESHRVTVEVRGQGAVTTVKEVFRNQYNQQLEATFAFPLPEKAAVTDFRMYVDGRLVTGEIKDAREARDIYQDIVRRMRDPGLLEYAGSNLIKLSVFPIPPHGAQEVRITYAETLAADSGLVEYVYPMRTPQKAVRTMKDFTLSVDITADAGLKNVYSPSHDISVTRVDDRHVKAGFERSGAALDRDFHLFYSLSDKDFGASLISHMARGGDGYFLLLLSPKVEVSPDEVSPKDVVFVIDVSGSMKSGKLDQAKKALLFCVSRLNRDDRFNVVAFSDGVKSMSEEPLPASEDNRARAKDFISGLAAEGGTDIDSALQAALRSGSDKARPSYVVFLTDGEPTVGETDAGQIVKNVAKRSDSSVRVFSFGVGNDVNTKLLDGIAEATNAVNQYVHPDEDIETRVSSFFAKVGDPVLSDIEIGYGGADVYDVLPRKPGDLFTGSQLVLAGRYRDDGRATIVVKGRGGKGQKTFEYPVTFASAGDDNAFVSDLWASRKIAFLLGEIRLHGEKAELRDEVVRLSKEHGIVTPYTSYLVTDGSVVSAAAADTDARTAPRRLHGALLLLDAGAQRGRRRAAGERAGIIV